MLAWAVESPELVAQDAQGSSAAEDQRTGWAAVSGETFSY